MPQRKQQTLPKRVPDIAERVAQLIANEYVFPEVATKICRVLTALVAEGRYSGLAEPDLAAKMTDDLQSVNGDKHLRLVYHTDALPERADDTEVQREFFHTWSQATCGGVARAERLPGNVGHLEIRPIIFPGPNAGDNIAAAMTLLSSTEALILDLRGCLGGEPNTVAFLCSYLFGEPVELSGMYLRKADRVQQMWTTVYVPGRKFGPDKPVYVLTSANTFSGGEAIAYDLKHLGRATVVGETTRGGAHPREGYRITPHLEATIPTGRSVSPVTGSNWEGIGVIPDVPATAADALATAHRMALEHVLATSSDHSLDHRVLDEARDQLG